MSIALIHTRPDITKPHFTELYVLKKLPIRRTGEYLGCDPQTVKHYLRLFGIPLRSRKQAYACRIITRAGQHSHYPKRDFDGTQALKAYLIGFRLGDLSVYRSSAGPFCRTIEVRGRTTQQAQVDLFKELFEPYGHINSTNIDRNGGIYLVAYLNLSFDFLVPKADVVEPWIQADAACAVAFIAGYLDAEGSFHITASTRTGLRKSVCAVATQDYEILTWMHRWFRSAGIRCQPPKLSLRRGTPRPFSLNKDYWILQVPRKDALVQLIQMLQTWIRHPKRRADMQRVLENIKERNRHPNLKYAYRSHRLWASHAIL